MSDPRQSAAPNPVAESISVDIYDQTYHLRGTNPRHIAELASIVDAKMRAVSAQGSTVDSLRVAVLASLNIADELVTLRDKYRSLTGTVDETQTTMKTRADSLAGLLDAVLEDRKAG
ncbi:MAG: cell division protein ZapA [Acidobacteriaceae bacterium]